MLRELAIKNFAIIDDLSVSFRGGLSVLTGETGAGKSILLNAVNLIMGGRASAEMIRSSEEMAELEALFEVPYESGASKVAQAQGVDLAEGLLIRRIIHKNGRHKIYINGRLATGHMLSEINIHLASISGQHAYQGLLKSEEHLYLLDHFGGTSRLCHKVSDCYKKVLPLIRHLAELKGKESEQAERRELLEFQVREIKQSEVFLGEDDQLEQERERLRHAERLYETVGKCVDLLYGIDGAVVERLTGISKELQTLCNIDQALSVVTKRLEAAAFDMEDVASGLQDYLQGVVFDTDRLEVIESRLYTLEKLKRKYGGSLGSVLAYGSEAEEELEQVTLLPEKIDQIETQLARAHKELGRLCRELSDKRRKAAVHLAQFAQKDLATLGMAKTRFEVSFKQVPVGEDTDPHLVLDNTGMEATGIDRVEFLIAPNVGEELRPLAHIASGGELSRIVLALKSMLATKDAVETLIFDEVDAGIGGGVAEMVGKKLESLARFHQVICITHIPQIACFGRNHFRIEKGVRGGRTRTTIMSLEGEARIQELARMLGGARITKKTMEYAREMFLRHEPPR